MNVDQCDQIESGGTDSDHSSIPRPSGSNVRHIPIQNVAADFRPIYFPSKELSRPSSLISALAESSLSQNNQCTPDSGRLLKTNLFKNDQKYLNSEGKENSFPSLDYLTNSPLSPPSPFHHPFFRRQLGLRTPDSFSRFSGFGLPRLSPLLKDFSCPPSKTENPEPRNLMRVSEQRDRYRMSTTSNILLFNQDTNSYKVCRETRFLSTYSDGVSESESEEEDDANSIFTVPEASSNKQAVLNPSVAGDCVGENSSTSSREDGTPFSTASSSFSNGNGSVIVSNRSDVSDVENSSRVNRNSVSASSEHNALSKRLSHGVSSEADGDEANSFASEPDSFHDVPSPRSSFCSLEAEEVDSTSQYPEESNGTSRPIEKLLRQEHSKEDKLHKIALELLHTERSYVDVLYLIDQEFQFRVDQQNRVHHMFPTDQMPLMFANIKSIYKLHHDFLLPQLEERMAQFETCRKIGDIMKSFAPFLKMYTEYVRNFDAAMTLISSWQTKNSKFAAIMDEIHQMKACGSLTLQHHMLSPVQRIPRYEMLLKDYLRKLPEDDQDKQETEEALFLVSTAANHANEAMKKIDKFKKLLEVQESLGGSVELVSPTRELLKEGRIIKISARSGDHQERYLFLLSDLLLLCTPRLIGGRVISAPHYRLRAKYIVENLQVLEGDNLETANTFYIKDNDKTVELYTQTKEEKESWLESLFHAIDSAQQRKSSLRLTSDSGESTPVSSSDPELGLKRPVMVPSEGTSECHGCAAHFSVVRRKHHCRACGSVVCHKCSSYKASLPCESDKSVRVCKSCHQALKERAAASSTLATSASVDTDLDKESDSSQSRCSSRPESVDFSNFDHLIWKSKGVLEIPGDAPGAIMKGYLQLKTHRKAWLKRWFCLHRDFVLYSFRAHDDVQALTATPVPGFTVIRFQSSKGASKGESGVGEKDRDKALKLYHAKKQYIFLCTTKEIADKWYIALQMASRAEVASPMD